MPKFRPLPFARAALALAAVCVAAHASAAPNPVPEAGQDWRGSYVCDGIRTPLELTIEYVNRGVSPTRSGPALGVRARFAFGDPRDVQHSGKYIVEGAYFIAARDMQLEPVRWIVRPPGYLMVGLSGHLTDAPRAYAGRIDAGNCAGFSLHAVR